ncbi:MAG: GspE/PulE family protein [bacterium]|nr:GspE/PulE family protein [bacterium]
MFSPSDRSSRVKQVYTDLDRKFEEEEAQSKALSASLPYMSLYGFPIDHNVLGLIPKEIATSSGTVAFYKEGRNIKLGVMGPSPQINQIVNDLKAKSLFVQLYLISESSFKHAMTFYDRIVSAARKSQDIRIESDVAEVRINSLKELEHKFYGVSATELIYLVLGAALPIDASDVHIEPDVKDVKVRFRIDGVLQDIARMPKDTHHQLVSRIKIMSKLKLNTVTIPQDGSFSLTYNKLPVDIRVSILPSAFGESLVLRVLRQDKQSLKFDELGISGLAQQNLLTQMRKPNGMILATGPTGSGKTTTLYAILGKLNEPGVKIITLEDPVEYKIPGITQTPIDKNGGLSFAAGLRAIVRQDPDIIMVGEMRDLETAETAAQAALTGHVVLSTLHTNDAASAIPRLLDFGVKPFVLAPAINAVIGQRLVRKICPDCKTEYTPAKNLMDRVELILGKTSKAAKVKLPAKLVFYHSTGCDSCKGLGYKGRVGVYEIFVVNEAIEKLVHQQAINTDVKNQAIADGMVTMAQDGLLKALAGITDVEEVFRVTEE